MNIATELAGTLFIELTKTARDAVERLRDLEGIEDTSIEFAYREIKDLTLRAQVAGESGPTLVQTPAPVPATTDRLPMPNKPDQYVSDDILMNRAGITMRNGEARCPECSHKMWDNRPISSPQAPEFRCSNPQHFDPSGRKKKDGTPFSFSIWLKDGVVEGRESRVPDAQTAATEALDLQPV